MSVCKKRCFQVCCIILGYSRNLQMAAAKPAPRPADPPAALKLHCDDAARAEGPASSGDETMLRSALKLILAFCAAAQIQGATAQPYKLRVATVGVPPSM